MPRPGVRPPTVGSGGDDRSFRRPPDSFPTNRRSRPPRLGRHPIGRWPRADAIGRFETAALAVGFDIGDRVGAVASDDRADTAPDVPRAAGVSGRTAVDARAHAPMVKRGSKSVRTRVVVQVGGGRAGEGDGLPPGLEVVGGDQTVLDSQGGGPGQPVLVVGRGEVLSRIHSLERCGGTRRRWRGPPEPPSASGPAWRRFAWLMKDLLVRLDDDRTETLAASDVVDPIHVPIVAREGRAGPQGHETGVHEPGRDCPPSWPLPGPARRGVLGTGRPEAGRRQSRLADPGLTASDCPSGSPGLAPGDSFPATISTSAHPPRHLHAEHLHPKLLHRRPFRPSAVRWPQPATSSYRGPCGAPNSSLFNEDGLQP